MASRGFDVSGASMAISAMLLDIISLRKATKLPSQLHSKDVPEMQILIEPAPSPHQSRRVGFGQLDDGIGCVVGADDNLVTGEILVRPLERGLYFPPRLAMTLA